MSFLKSNYLTESQRYRGYKERSPARETRLSGRGSLDV